MKKKLWKGISGEKKLLKPIPVKIIGPYGLSLNYEASRLNPMIPAIRVTNLARETMERELFGIGSCSAKITAYYDLGENIERVYHEVEFMDHTIHSCGFTNVKTEIEFKNIDNKKYPVVKLVFNPHNIIPYVCNEIAYQITGRMPTVLIGEVLLDD